MRSKFFIGSALVLVTMVLSLSPSSAMRKQVEQVDLIGETMSGLVNLTFQTRRGRVVARGTVDRMDPTLQAELDSGLFKLTLWIVDAGEAGGIGTSSVDTRNLPPQEEPPFGSEGITPANFTVVDSQNASIGLPNVPFINLVKSVPFARLIGPMERQSNGNYTVRSNISINNGILPYGSFMVVKESSGDLDPRPSGEQLAIGRRSF